MSKRESRGSATYDDLLRLPDDLIAEMIDGELYASPRPSGRHVRASSVLARRIGTAFDDGIGGPGGWWIVIEPEIHLGSDVVVPDIAGWRRETMPEYPAGPAVEMPPDWVCEVVSPRTAALDRVKKLPRYAQSLVRHAWIIDPASRTLEVYSLAGEHYSLIETFEAEEVGRGEPFEAIELRLSDLWL